MQRITNPDSGFYRRKGNTYLISPFEIEQFNDLGYVVLNDVLTEEELK